MVMKTVYWVPPFELHREKLGPARQAPAPRESGVLKEAEAMAERLLGTAALKIVADDGPGELGSATILGQWGEVLDDFAADLRGA